MSKKMITICFVAAFALSAIVYLFFFHNVITSDFTTDVIIRSFEYKDFQEGDYHTENFEVSVTNKDDVAEFRNILRGRYFSDSPACGFSMYVSVTMTNGSESIMFCPANDGCPLLRIGDSDMYIRISEKNREILDEILAKYGMFFPCI